MGWYPNEGGRDFGPSLDRWITGNYGEDQFKNAPCCPNCGKNDVFTDTTANDPEHPDEVVTTLTCECGWVGTEDDLVEPGDPRDDEPADFDERRDMGLD
jgi:hypothetical protein